MRTTTLLFSLLLITGSSAQPILRRPPTIGVGLEVGSPIGAFDDTWGREMAGLSGNFTAPMGVLPFDWGLDVGWARMGSARDVVAVNEENLEATTGDIKVNSNIYSYHAQLRLKPFNGKVSPYIEAMAGTRQFTTRTEINVDGLDQPLREERNASAFTWSTGWAAGVQVAAGKVLYFEGRVERLNGGEVTYVDPASIAISPEGQVSYGTLTSGSRIVNVHVGIGLRF